MSQPAFNQPSFPELYERHLVGPLFRPWAEVLLDEMALAAGESLLDVACGTGIVARLARERSDAGARIAGIDASAQMLAVARAVAPDIEWREGNAIALPLREGETFDVVACQQGLQFMPDKPAAIREMKRALRPGGRLGIATWRPIGETALLDEMHRAAQKYLGAFVDSRHSFGEAEPLEALLREAGFTDIRVTTRSCPMRFEDGAAFARMNAMGLVNMSPKGKEMNEEQRADTVAMILRDSAPVIEKHTGASGLTFDLGSNIATCRRPA